MNLKLCQKCLEEKEYEAFPKGTNAPDGLFRWCRLCLSEHRKSLWKKKPKKPRVYALTHKVCSYCKIKQPRENFRKYKANTLHYRCIDCEDNFDRLDRQGRWVCSDCNEEKPLDAFYASRRGTHASAQCIECQKKYNKKNWTTTRFKRIEKQYGLTQDQYLELFNKQDGKCAICGWFPLSGQNNLAVDHCHATGEVRGLLCYPCNHGLGHFKDDPKLFRKASEYLSKVHTGVFAPIREKRKKK